MIFDQAGARSHSVPPLLSQKTALFLDFDGTLVELAPTPDGIYVPDGLAKLLSELDAYLGGAMAIVTGRTLDNVFRFLAPFSGPAAGSHGLEMRLADGAAVLPGGEVAGQAASIAASLSALVAQNDALFVENKNWSTSLHYRQAPEMEAACIAAMEAAVSMHPEWEIIRGKMIVEARPSGVSKGTAVNTLMESAPFAGRRPVFIGDDVTDEDGMRAAAELGGFGIKVGPGETAAQFRLEGVDAVYAYLAGTMEN